MEEDEEKFLLLSSFASDFLPVSPSHVLRARYTQTMQLDKRSQRQLLRAGVFFIASVLVLSIVTSWSARPSELTYWEDQTG
eukprot:762128-Hanusia_phi.AAC.13